MSTITFELPASDEDLVDQVFDFVDEYDVDHGEMLLGMARKYRFAGYIGTISYLFAKVNELQRELEEVRTQKSKWWPW
jgi:hypothetical protein